MRGMACRECGGHELDRDEVTERLGPGVDTLDAERDRPETARGAAVRRLLGPASGKGQPALHVTFEV